MMLNTKRWLYKLIGLTVLSALVAMGAVWGYQHYQQEFLQSLLERPLSASVEMKVTPGDSLSRIAKTGVQTGLPVSRLEFIQLAHFLDVGESLQAGNYSFPAGDSIQSVLEGLAKGKTIVEKITVVEGKTFLQMRQQLESDSRLQKKLAGMSVEDIRQALGIKEDNIEGLFLPDTYFFQQGDSDFSILKRSYQRLQTVLKQQWEKRAEDFFKTPYEALILASIVEKETGQAEERPMIASVFLNRLRKGIRLQADPTVIYGVGEKFDGNLTRKHLRADTPYNTYVRAGLTPTPIALVGEAAIMAVLQPATSDYYYFVATGDGGHYFSKTLREHNNAVNRYQIKRQK